MTRDGYEPVPAIVRSIDKEKDSPTVKRHKDSAEKIISQPQDTVTFSRGFGESGYRVQVVNHDCPECGFDRMIRRVDVCADRQNEVRYWCLNPNCVHFVRDSLSFACHGNYPQRDTDEPAVFEKGDA
jgi:predicted RNA-binding Zn-ribbon protein involved in translation (DUF1610 family)